MTNPYQSYSDHPATADELGFTPSADALRSIITGAQLADTPLTIGVYGPWGSGKTSLMQMILGKLNPAQCVPIWFEAWRYAQADALWRALLISVVEELRAYILPEGDATRLVALIERRNRIDPHAPQTGTDAQALKDERAKLNARLDDLIDSLYRSVEREELGGLEINWGEAGKLALRTAIRVGFDSLPVLGALTKAVEQAHANVGEEDYVGGIAAILQRERATIYREHIRSLDQFHRSLKQLVKEWIIDADLRLVIFIDDLDRCLPEQAVGVLEAIKVFLDMQGCIFVLGVDREIIERGIRVRYKEFALDANRTAPLPIGERDYLEKIVQVPFELPPLDETEIELFLNARLQGVVDLSPDDSKRIATIMTAGLLRNPRKVKRTFNTLRLHLALATARKRQAPPALLAKLVVIQSSFAEVYERVVRAPTLLKDLEAAARDLQGQNIDNDIKSLVTDNPRLDRMLFHEPFFAQLDDEELNNLVFQTRTTRDR
jgi:hypothetical protein